MAGTDDKAKAMGEELKGHAKRALGALTDDDERVDEGEAQVEKGREVRRAQSHAEQAAEAEKDEVEAQLRQ